MARRREAQIKRFISSLRGLFWSFVNVLGSTFERVILRLSQRFVGQRLGAILRVYQGFEGSTFEERLRGYFEVRSISRGTTFERLF